MLSDEYGVSHKYSLGHAAQNELDLTLPTRTRLDAVPGANSLAARMLKGEFDADHRAGFS